MKYQIDGILVVEGTSDASFLSSFIDCELVTTNGLDLPGDKLAYLAAASAKKQIIVLTDPDAAGEEIRRRIHEKIKCVDARVDVSKCNRKNKHGVAECLKSEIIDSLKPFFTIVKKSENILTANDLFSLGIDNKQIYLFLEKKYKCYFGNNKQFLRCLNTLEITKNELAKAVEEYKNGNQSL
ncbi:MAG: DUF4093 domain-containing protein [Bacilli bacterium]|nr:DUF4093 domain-containing protein [Bacilli bacterium]